MKKVHSIIGIVVSIAVAFFGVLVLFGAMGGDTDIASGASYLYDSGYASFGGDFYTYVNNNAAEAASATKTIARNLNEISILLKNVCGIFLIGFGLMGFCFFGGISNDEEGGILVKVNEQPSDATFTGTNSAAWEDEKKKQQAAGSWTCRCGKVNAGYVSSCSCGTNKHDIG